MTENCMSISGISVTGVFRLKKSASPQNSPRVFLICIKRGESGYYPSDWNTADKARNEDMADELNEKLGVTSAQRQAMEVGSMAG